MPKLFQHILIVIVQASITILIGAFIGFILLKAGVYKPGVYEVDILNDSGGVVKAIRNVKFYKVKRQCVYLETLDNEVYILRESVKIHETSR